MRKAGELRMRQSGSPRRSVKRLILPAPLHPTSHARSTSSTTAWSRSTSYSRTTTTAAAASIIFGAALGNTLLLTLLVLGEDLDGAAAVCGMWCVRLVLDISSCERRAEEAASMDHVSARGKARAFSFACLLPRSSTITPPPTHETAE
jgi:hypothetical protein